MILDAHLEIDEGRQHAMTLKRSRGGHKAAHTIKKRKLASLMQRRFPRQSPEQTAKQLRYWIETNQVVWTSDLLRLAVEDAKKQGFNP
jgi:hypothetical protein